MAIFSMKSNLLASIKSKSFLIGVCSSVPALIFILLIPAGEAGFFSYKDENGKTHYTDDLSEIPIKYRESEKGIHKYKDAPKDTSTPIGPPLVPPVAIAPAEAQGRPASANEIQVPLKEKGNTGNYYVDVMLNGSVPAYLLLDTGASDVTLSKEIAEKLGLSFANTNAKQTYNTANGKAEFAITTLQTVEVGNARSMLVEASFNDDYGGSDGLLGMSFLEDFRFEIDRINELLILKPLAEGEMEWGGKTGSWWKRRFDTYNKAIKKYSGGARRLHYYRDSRSAEYKYLAEHYINAKKRLETQADASRVPKRFR